MEERENWMKDANLEKGEGGWIEAADLYTWDECGGLVVSADEATEIIVRLKAHRDASVKLLKELARNVRNSA